jgi:hypothetical protein
MKLVKTKKHQLMPLFSAFILAIAVHSEKAQAQVVVRLEANIPFQFSVANTELPAGKYYIRLLDDSNLTIMEISTVDGSSSALFDVRSADVNSPPAKSELNFNKYGNRYFLASLFEEGDADGSKVVESRDEKKMDQANREVERVAAHRQGQAGN